MATGQGGYYTANLTIATGGTFGPTALVAADLQVPNGSSPQTLAIPLGLLSQANNNATGITAHAGGGQTAAYQLDYGISNVTVVATAADSVKLPPCIAGAWCFVKNSDASDSMTVFGYGTDTIDSVASATGNAQAAGKGKLYFGVVGTGTGVAGNWVSLLGA